MRIPNHGADHREGEYTEVVQKTVVCGPVPKRQLRSIVELLSDVARLSEGQVSVPELADALIHVYDPESMMIYDASGHGLAPPVGGWELATVDGCNKRDDIITDIFNSGFWDESRTGMVHGVHATALSVLKSDAGYLKRALWQFFFPTPSETPTSEMPTIAPPASGDEFGGACPGINVQVPMAEADNASASRQTGNTNHETKWPWGTHHTDALGHLEAAAKSLWTTYDSDKIGTAPTNKEVSDWLQKERGVTERMADSIASILRADGIRTGPR